MVKTRNARQEKKGERQSTREVFDGSYRRQSSKRAIHRLSEARCVLFFEERSSSKYQRKVLISSRMSRCGKSR